MLEESFSETLRDYSGQKNSYPKENSRNIVEDPHKIKMCSMQIKSVIKYY